MNITNINSSAYNLDRVYNNQANGTIRQEPKEKPEPPSVEDIVSMLTSKLGLNDNQMIELKKIVQDSMTKLDEEAKTSETENSDKKTAMNKMKSIMDEMDEKIKGILSDDQLKAFEAMINRRKSGMEQA
jgi:hypothetical protein